MTRHDRCDRRDRGQAAVEFALAVPVVVVMALGIVQVLVIGARHVTLEQLARNGVRAASVAADPRSAAIREVGAATRLTGVSVDVTVDAGLVTVTVGYVDRTDIPVVGRAIGDVRLEASATMAREPP